jgi:hypothetical protein
VVEEIAQRDPEPRRSSMISTHHTLTRLARGIAVAALVAVLTAPAALAKQDPWFNYATSISAGESNATFITPQNRDLAGGSYYNQTALPKPVQAPQAPAAGGATPPAAPPPVDALAPGGGSARVQGYRFVTDTLAPGGGIVAVAPATPGFDWTDAGIGAAGTAGLMLILLGGTRRLTHRRNVLAV